MVSYLIRRVITCLIVVIGVSIAIFFMLHTIYPSPAIDVLGPKSSPQAIAAWNKANGFDRPWIAQYLSYMNRLVHGNLGYSYKVNQSVAALFGERWARSLYLSGTSLVLAAIIARPVGVFWAVTRSTIDQRAVTAVERTADAMPLLFRGLVL